MALIGWTLVEMLILAAIVLTLLPEVLRNVNRDLADWRMVIYSALLIAMMLIRPQGLLGGRELWPKRWRRRLRRAGFPVVHPATPTVEAKA